MNSLLDYLKLYNQDCWLVYRPIGAGWTDRVRYQSDEFEPSKPYNHRSIFDNEVVWDFDDDNKANNAEKSAELFIHTPIVCAWWGSGNKGYHVHSFWDFGGVSNVALMKRCILEYYKPEGAKIDMQLTGAHLIRAEFGLNEKSGNHKTLISKTWNFGKVLNVIPEQVWANYNHKIRQQISRVHNKGSIAAHPDVQYFIKTHEFGPKSDGHERALWMLCQVLKGQWKEDKEGFIKHMQDWYKASGGKSMSDAEVRRKVIYHWNKDYTVSISDFTHLREDI
mgnify:CR=1 FL=1